MVWPLHKLRHSHNFFPPITFPLEGSWMICNLIFPMGISDVVHCGFWHFQHAGEEILSPVSDPGSWRSLVNSTFNSPITLNKDSITFLLLCTLLPCSLFLNKLYLISMKFLLSDLLVWPSREAGGGGRTIFLNRQPQAAWINTVFSFSCYFSETTSHESICTLESVPLKHFSE